MAEPDQCVIGAAWAEVNKIDPKHLPKVKQAIAQLRLYKACKLSHLSVQELGAVLDLVADKIERTRPRSILPWRKHA